jgi:SAM-dependent methyltransferase
VLSRLAADCGTREALELGSGTGNATFAFQQAYPCRLFGAELSRGMLEKAWAKAIPGVAWLRANAMAIPLADRSVDFVFACYMLHYVPDLARAFAECRRVLRPGGAVAFVTTPHDYIRRHPMAHYFPSFAPIDLARFPSEETLLATLRQVGFERVQSETVSEPRVVDRAYAERVADRHLSTFDLIPEAEFQEGLKRLYADLEANGSIPAECGWEALIVHGRRAES